MNNNIPETSELEIEEVQSEEVAIPAFSLPPGYVIVKEVDLLRLERLAQGRHRGLRGLLGSIKSGQFPDKAKRKLGQVGVTRKDKSASKTRRKTARHSRKINRGK